MGAWVVLTAAGGGSRLGAGVPKALVEVGERTILELALERVLFSSKVDGVVVTCPRGSLWQFRRLAEQWWASLVGDAPPFTSRLFFVEGGTSRQGSVFAGLQEVERRRGSADGRSPILVHDAARCLAPSDLVDRMVAAIEDGAQAAIPVLPVVDTIKQVDPATGLVAGTPDRELLRIVQTPQAFAWDVLYDAHVAQKMRGGDEQSAATDDAALVEEQGVPVLTVPGDPLAFKVTLPEDIERARGLLA